MNPAKYPCATQEFLALGSFEHAREPFTATARRKLSLYSRAKHFEHARHGDQRGGALSFYGAHNFRRVRGRFDHDSRSQERGNQQRHKLAKYMAEGHERHEAQRMKPTLVFSVGSDARFQRLKIRQEVAVS